MTESDIKKVIESNEADKLNLYLTSLLSKSNEIQKENNKLGIMMLILVLLVYLIETTNAEAMNIGPVFIKDINAIKILIPLVFAFLILRYMVINSHKAEIIRIVKKFSVYYFNYENTNMEPEFTDDLTRTLLPISIYEEFNKLNNKGTSKIGCVGAFLTFPLALSLVITPYYLEFIWLKEPLITYCLVLK